MKNHFAVTISDAFGSRHYTVRKTVQRYLAIGAVVIVASIAGNFGQHWLSYRIITENTWFTQRHSHMGEELAFLTEQARAINRELIEIESLAQVEITSENAGENNVENTDETSTLIQRLRTILRFYNGRDEEYSEIGARLVRIEKMVNAMDNSTDNDLNKDPDNSIEDDNSAQFAIAGQDEKSALAARVKMVALSVQQESILHNNIPNGSPTKTMVITSKFGNRVHPVTKVKSLHRGIDLRAKKRSEVMATADGIVRTAEYSKLNGNHVIIRHNFGFESYFAHLHKMKVKPGDAILKGDVVGLSGNSGQSAGPHLHYEIRYLGKSINPIDFLKWEFGSHEIFTHVKEIKWQSLISLINRQITHPTLQLSQLDPVSPEK